MNAKYSSVEDTVVSKNHVLSTVGLPTLSSKYQILSGVCTPTANATYNLLDDNGQQLIIPSFSYIEKILLSRGSKDALSAGSIFDVQLASRGVDGTYTSSGSSLLSLINVAGTNNPLATTTLGTGLVATDSLSPPATVTAAIVNAGVMAIPDVTTSSETQLYPVVVTTGTAVTTGKVRATFFIVTL
jgi:hypothetical protein